MIGGSLTWAGSGGFNQFPTPSLKRELEMHTLSACGGS